MTDTRFFIVWFSIGVCVGLFWAGLLALFHLPALALALFVGCVLAGPRVGQWCKGAAMQDEGRE
jgi:hypothetical protein